MEGYSVAVGNSRAFGGGMMLLPHAELDDGLLDVLMIADGPKLPSKLPNGAAWPAWTKRWWKTVSAMSSSRVRPTNAAMTRSARYTTTSGSAPSSSTQLSCG